MPLAWLALLLVGCPGAATTDADRDGHPAAWDCDDGDASVHPDAAERCNGIDDDCDGAADEEDAVDAVVLFRDADGDGAGDASTRKTSCSALDGWVNDDTDCDDADPSLLGAEPEVPYDGIDQDCDGSDRTDVDGDGWDALEAGGEDCDDTDPDVHPGATELPDDGIDQDCDGEDAGEDLDGDGYTAFLDCDDGDVDVHPGATERFGDGVDRDCDGDPNTQPLEVGALAWEMPRRPVLARDPQGGYLLATSADGFVRETGVGYEDAGVMLAFAADSEAAASPFDVEIFQGTTTTWPLGEGVALLAGDGLAWAAFGYARGSRQYLLVREMRWDAALEGYDQLAASLAFVSATSEEAMLGADLAARADGSVVAAAVGADWTAWVTAQSAEGGLEQEAEGADETLGGRVLFLVDDGEGLAVDGGAGLGAYSLPSLQEAGERRWAGLPVVAVSREGDRLALALEDGGVVLDDGSRSIPVLDGRAVTALAATWHDLDADGEDEVLIALADEAGLVLAWGAPDGVLEEAVFPLTDGTTTEAARQVAVRADADRLVLAASGETLLGWSFLRWP